MIIQVYEQQMRYQAYKKFSIYKLVSSCTNIPVPHVFDVGETAEHSYVIMKEMPGVRLSLVKEELDFTILDIIPSMSQILSEIHSKINIGKYYGWIEKEVVINPSNNLVNYLDSEIERFDKSLNGIIDKQVKSKILIKARDAVNHIGSYKHFCSLVWFDIHPDNILVAKKNGLYSISGWLDPGASRVGSGAWDLAYAKFEFNKAEFELLKNEYAKVSNTDFDDSLIDAFLILVAIDILILGLLESWDELAKKSLNLLLKS